MRVFVAGATGAIGRALLPRLRHAGHEVTGMTRSPERAQRLRDEGFDAVVCDALDAETLREAVAGASPEAVVHELTELPSALNPRRLGQQLAATNRLRVEGTHNLIEASRAAGAGRIVAQSIAFAYPPSGEWVKKEDDPLYVDAPGAWGEAVRSVAELEHSVTQADGLEGVALRYGYFYGPGTAYAPDGSFARVVRKRRVPVVGEGGARWSFVHVEDAARATVEALERAQGGRVFNIVDDDPAPVREWLPAFAEALGAPAPRRVPTLLARVAAGRVGVHQMTALRGASNARARHELGWEPWHPTWREGFRATLG